MQSKSKKDLIDKLSAIGIRVLVTVSLLLGFLLVIFGGYSIYEQLYTQTRAFSTWGINIEEAQSVEVQENLALQNKDYRGILQIDDTKIKYPVMQDGDELYYAYHNTAGQSSLTGSIYMSAFNKSDWSDDYIVIYGHHMDNGAMFGNLDKSNLAAYCYNYGEWVELVKRKSALDAYDPEGIKLILAIDKQIKVHEDQFRRFGSACGMDPSGRLKAAAKQTQTEQETIEARFGAI